MQLSNKPKSQLGKNSNLSLDMTLKVKPCLIQWEFQIPTDHIVNWIHPSINN